MTTTARLAINVVKRPIQGGVGRFMHPSTYAITVRGEAGRTTRASFEDVEISVHDGRTTFRARVPDQAALYGLIQRIEAFGLELLDISLIGPDDAKGNHEYHETW